MLISTSAIVLSQIKVGDNSHIVHLYTLSHGPLTVMVKGSKRAALRSVFMQPLSLIEVVISMRPKQSILHIKESRPAQILTSIPYNPVKSAIAMFLAEWLSHSIREQHPDAPLYAFIEQSILAFDEMESGYANFHLVFLIKMTYFLGIFPNLSHFDEGVYFDLQNSCFTNVIPLHSNYLDPVDSLAFAHLMRLNYDTMHLYALNRSEERRVGKEC